MAKRKAAASRRRPPRKRAATGRKRAVARKTTLRRAAAKKPARKKAARPKAAARTTRASARKKIARSAVARKRTAKAAPLRRVSRPKAPAAKAAPKKKAAPVGMRHHAPRTVPRKAPALDRARRIVQGDDIVPTPPSSLDLDRSASAVRTGRRQLRERLAEHTETGPALTAGDVDADWESAYSVGDEAPGGDNPTPDQDVVDDIGKAVGVEYDDNEELKGEAKITKRDKHRWELDPASSEDYEDR